MHRYTDDRLVQDLTLKMVFLTGPRQVGKTTISQQLVQSLPGSQDLNFDVAAHRAIILAQTWRHSAPLLVLDAKQKSALCCQRQAITSKLMESKAIAIFQKSCRA